MSTRQLPSGVSWWARCLSEKKSPRSYSGNVSKFWICPRRWKPAIRGDLETGASGRHAQTRPNDDSDQRFESLERPLQLSRGLHQRHAALGGQTPTETPRLQRDERAHPRGRLIRVDAHRLDVGTSPVEACLDLARECVGDILG